MVDVDMLKIEVELRELEHCWAGMGGVKRKASQHGYQASAAKQQQQD
jgi:hypothetical protein